MLLRPRTLVLSQAGSEAPVLLIQEAPPRNRPRRRSPARFMDIACTSFAIRVARQVCQPAVVYAPSRLAEPSHDDSWDGCRAVVFEGSSGGERRGFGGGAERALNERLRAEVRALPVMCQEVRVRRD